MLDANLKQQLQGLLTNLREPIELIASLGDDAKSAELATLLDDIAALSDKVSVTRADDEPPRLNPKYTFDTFVIGAGNRFALVEFLAAQNGHKRTRPGVGIDNGQQAFLEPGHQRRPVGVLHHRRIEKNAAGNAFRDAGRVLPIDNGGKQVVDAGMGH